MKKTYLSDCCKAKVLGMETDVNTKFCMQCGMLCHQIEIVETSWLDKVRFSFRALQDILLVALIICNFLYLLLLLTH